MTPKSADAGKKAGHGFDGSGLRIQGLGFTVRVLGKLNLKSFGCLHTRVTELR